METVKIGDLDRDEDDERLHGRMLGAAQSIVARNILQGIIEERDGSVDPEAMRAIKWVKGVGFVTEETNEERARRWCLSQCAAGGHRIDLGEDLDLEDLETPCDCVASLAAEFASIKRW